MIAREPSRSDFIKLTSSFVGSLVLVAGLDSCAKPTAEQMAAAPAFSPNVWLSIHPDNTATFVLNRSEMGQGVFTGLPSLIADELDIGLDRVTVEVASPNPKYLYPNTKEMITGGSTAIRTSWLPLRTAGATARAMLVQAAAKQWNVDASALTTSNGVVFDRASNRSATYGSLVAAALQLAVPDNVRLKTPQEFTIIGKPSTQRLDIPSKVDGSAKYGIDVVVPGMKYAAIARSPVFGGTVKSFDASKAKAVKGVSDVVQVPTGIAVIADHTWAAFQGKNALVVEWNEGPNASLDSAAMFAEAERLARDPQNAAVALQRGNANGATGKTVEAIYEGPFLAHAAMEPMNATASVTEDGVEIWAPTQAQTRVQNAAAKITGLPLERIVVHTTMLGGGFGRRLQSDYTEEAVAVSKAIKAPVKVQWTREDDIQHDFYRPMSVNAISGELDANGQLVAMKHTVVAEAISRQYRPKQFSQSHGVDGSALNGITDAPYTVANYTVQYLENEHGVPVGSWRAPDANWNTFVVESFMDELAHDAGKDPVAFRLAALPPNSAAARCLREAASRSKWGTRQPGVTQGVAVMVWNGSTGALIADVSMNRGTPKVQHVTCVVHCGTVVNPEIVVAQTRSAINYGLSAALTGKITLKNGRVEQSNFDSYTVLHMADAPSSIDVYALPSSEHPTGIGELGLPGIAPAIANAVFAATGKRIRRLPLSDSLT